MFWDRLPVARQVPAHSWTCLLKTPLASSCALGQGQVKAPVRGQGCAFCSPGRESGAQLHAVRPEPREEAVAKAGAQGRPFSQWLQTEPDLAPSCCQGP